MPNTASTKPSLTACSVPATSPPCLTPSSPQRIRPSLSVRLCRCGARFARRADPSNLSPGGPAALSNVSWVGWRRETMRARFGVCLVGAPLTSLSDSRQSLCAHMLGRCTGGSCDTFANCEPGCAADWSQKQCTNMQLPQMIKRSSKAAELSATAKMCRDCLWTAGWCCGSCC